jgi:hypothetical protein
MKYLFTLLWMLFFISCKPKQQQVKEFNFSGKPGVPVSIKEQHDSLLFIITAIALNPDSTGKAAKKLKELLQHHFKEEEDFVLPALGVLPIIAAGKIPTESQQIILMVEKYKSNNVHLLAEHQMIIAYLRELVACAKMEKHDINFFTETLFNHAREEEQIYFPAAALVGEFLKCKTQS